MLWLKGAGLAGALALFAGCGDSPKPAAPAAPKASAGFLPGRVSFGVLAPLSGPHGERGRDLVDGARMAVADLNVRGGVNGQRVGIVAEDDGCEASAGRAGARRLREREIAGALGGICASAAGAAARTLGTGLPFLVTSANAPGIVSARRTPTAYLTSGTPYQSALATVHWLAYRTAQRLSVVTEDDRASRYLGRQVLGLSAPAPKAVSEQAVPAGTTDWSTTVKAALAGDPDFVYWAGSAAGGGSLLAALRDADYEGAFVASEDSESPEFLAAAGESAEGAFVIAPASPQNLPAAADWTARFTERFGHAPGRDALRAYEGLRALAYAVQESGKVDPERNASELAGLDEGYTTFLGGPPLQFASDHTIKFDDNIALTVSGGAFTVADLLRSES